MSGEWHTWVEGNNGAEGSEGQSLPDRDCTQPPSMVRRLALLRNFVCRQRVPVCVLWVGHSCGSLPSDQSLMIVPLSPVRFLASVSSSLHRPVKGIARRIHAVSPVVDQPGMTFLTCFLKSSDSLAHHFGHQRGSPRSLSSSAVVSDSSQSDSMIG